jgi:FixJ family two-component response regulator
MNPKNLNVNIVDDDADLLRALGNLFVSRGYPVQTFASGEAFLASAKAQMGGCVLLDLRMDPGMSGLQVFDELRRRDSPLAVVFLSGHGTVTEAVAAVQNGAYDWIEKPCKADDLLEKVTGVLEKAAVNLKRRSEKGKGLATWETLTPAEKLVAQEVRKGSADRVTAITLNKDFRTVQSQRAKVYSKLGVSNAPEVDRFMRDIDL